ncbi:MAG: four helix bundle protein [Pyrinomonadaceae bacterium]
MDLVVIIYELIKTFPREETYGLVSQLRRAAISVASNIAEGAADRTHDQFSNFLSVAIGSLNEINTRLEAAFRIGYLGKEQHDAVQAAVVECLAVTYGLRRKIKSDS